MQLYPIPTQSLLNSDSPTFAGLTLSGLTPSRLVQTDAGNALVSVGDLTSWIAGTSNQISVANDGDGTVTLSTPQNIATNSDMSLHSLSLHGGNLFLYEPILDALGATIYTDNSKYLYLLPAGGITKFAATSIELTSGNITTNSGTISSATLRGTTITGVSGGSITINTGGDLTLINDNNLIFTGTWGSVNGLLKITTAGVVTPGIAGTDYDNYWTRTGTLLTTRTAGDSITSTATITGEQLTSTDDITMAGLFTNTLASADTLGLKIDGNTNLFTYAALTTPMNSITRKTTGTHTAALPVLSGYNGALLYRYLTWDSDFSGTSQQFGSTLKYVQCGVDYLDWTGDIVLSSNGIPGANCNTIMLGSNNFCKYSGAFTDSTSKNNSVSVTGGAFTAQLQSSITINSTGTKTFRAIGGDFSGNSTGISLAGAGSTPIIEIYGIKSVATGTTDGTTTVYGGYFSGVSGDTNYDIYAANATSSNYFAGPTTCNTTLGVTGQATFTLAPIVNTLTAGRVVFVGASKELVDDADLTFATDTLTATKFIGTTQITSPALRLTSSTPTTLAGDVNDWDVGNKSFVRAAGGVADRIVTGILSSGVADGHVMYITNIGTTNKISFANESASSSAANRILTSIAGTIEIGPYHTAQFIYDSTSSRWREMSHL
jgi:hypothetical protein